MFVDKKAALTHLKKDPVMRKLIGKYEFPKWSDSSDVFSDLIEAIINQQLSSKAGETIFNRFKGLFKAQSFPTYREILTLSDEAIRACGISYTKITYIKGVCKAVGEKILKIEQLYELSDKEVVRELTKHKGVGRWTVEMILMFSLKRMDIFSMGDLGLRTAVSKWYNVDRDDHKAIEAIALQWRPYRSIASRYLWKSLESK